MISNGFARINYKDNTIPTKLLNLWKTLEDSAKHQALGIWGCHDVLEDDDEEDYY